MDDTVTLVVETKNYELSKQTLCEHSEYFSAMFNGEFLEKNKKIVKLEGIAVTSWEHIMLYIKYGRIKPHQTEEQEKKDRIKEIIRLLQDSTMLQFINIQEKCIRILYDELDSSNAIEILEVASQLDLGRLIHKARAVSLWYADDISASDAFYSLGIDQVEGLLSDPALHCSSGEWGVWEAIDRWINFSLDASETRQAYLQRLIKCLHLNSLSLSDLKGMGLYDYVRSDPVISEAIRIIIEERANKDKIDDSESIQNLTVKGSDAQAFIIDWKKTGSRKLPFVPALVGNIKIDADTTSPYILRFSESEKKFIPTLRLSKVETDIGCYVGYKVIAHGSKLYLFGGEIMARQGTWNHAVFEYDQIHTKWKFLTNILKPSRHLSGCCIGNDLYILGGFGRHRVVQDAVNKFSIKDESWTPCAPLPRPMYSVPCCVFREQIYVIESVVYQYSPNRDSWVTLDIVLPSKTIFNSAMANDKFIFLTGAFTKIVYKVDPSIPKTTLEKVGTFKNDCSQACLIDEYIYSLSQDEFGEEICCEKLNVNTGENSVIWEGVAGEGNEIANLDPKHHHGCFPFLFE